MPRREQKNDKQKVVAPSHKGRINTKAAHNRHQRSIQRAAEVRAEKIANGKPKDYNRAKAQQDKIDKKQATRARLRACTPAQRHERSMAGMEHRAPRSRIQ